VADATLLPSHQDYTAGTIGADDVPLRRNRLLLPVFEAAPGIKLHLIFSEQQKLDSATDGVNSCVNRCLR